MEQANSNQKQIFCSEGHILVLTDDLSLLHQNQAYQNNAYLCNACGILTSCKVLPSFHCRACKLDLCPTCTQVQQNINSSCDSGHPLFRVSDLRTFHSGHEYIGNKYICNRCRKQFSAITSPSTHCPKCKFDLCLDCFGLCEIQEISNALSKQNLDERSKGSANIPKMGLNSLDQPITCPSGHILASSSDLCLLHGNQVYQNNIYLCNACGISASCKVLPSYHCKACKFDLCPTCNQVQQNIISRCSSGHRLLRVFDLRTLHSGQEYVNNNYVCNHCRKQFGALASPSTHCPKCKYDLCLDCFGLCEMQEISNALSKQDVGERSKGSANVPEMGPQSLDQPITCPSRHILALSSDLRLLHENQAYQNNTYVCNACGILASCKVLPSYHCKACKFDLCPICNQVQQNINSNCTSGHSLFRVSNLRTFHSGQAYRDNKYICNRCEQVFHAEASPSTHCPQCKFDLCPDCYNR